MRRCCYGNGGDGVRWCRGVDVDVDDDGVAERGRVQVLCGRQDGSVYGLGRRWAAILSFILLVGFANGLAVMDHGAYIRRRFRC